MEIVRLTGCDHPVYEKAMELYRVSFPTHEQRESDSQHNIMGHDVYRFGLLYDENVWVGLLLYWETADFLYVEHFCIRPELRNQQYGQRALALLHEAGKTVILEIDLPKDLVAVRRKSFYTRVGYRMNAFVHRHPPYRKGLEAHELMVMSHPCLLSEEQYHAFRDFLNHVVMGN